MDKTEFYVTLPSNTHAGETTSDFRVHLPDNISLSGDWVVALSQIQYSKSWYNVTNDKDMNRITVCLNDLEFTPVSLDIEPNHYDTIDDLLAAITEAVVVKAQKLNESADEKENINNNNKRNYDSWKKFEHAINFRFDYVKKRVTIHIDKRYVQSIILSQLFAYMLGFRSCKLFNRNDVDDKADFPVDLRGGLDGLYVYCDLVENQIVGNSRDPLLCILPVEGIFGSIVDKSFISPHYLPLLKKDFSSVYISIKSDTNQPIQFAFGKVIVKLHFLRRHYEGAVHSIR